MHSIYQAVPWPLHPSTPIYVYVYGGETPYRGVSPIYINIKRCLVVEGAIPGPGRMKGYERPIHTNPYEEAPTTVGASPLSHIEAFFSALICD